MERELRHALLSCLTEVAILGALFLFGWKGGPLPTAANATLAGLGFALAPLVLGWKRWHPVAAVAPALAALMVVLVLAELVRGPNFYYDMGPVGFLVLTTFIWGPVVLTCYLVGYGANVGWDARGHLRARPSSPPHRPTLPR